MASSVSFLKEQEVPFAGHAVHTLELSPSADLLGLPLVSCL